MKYNKNNVSLEISAGFKNQFPNNSNPFIVFSGKSNVGKSSLINSLLGRKSLARTSNTPGKTITINFYNIDKSFYFVDLPGYGFAKRDSNVRNSLSKISSDFFDSDDCLNRIKMVVQIVDSRLSKPGDSDILMAKYLDYYNVKYVIVANKFDKLNTTDQNNNIECLKKEFIKADNIVPFSSLRGIGKTDLWKLIDQKLN